MAINVLWRTCRIRDIARTFLKRVCNFISPLGFAVRAVGAVA